MGIRAIELNDSTQAIIDGFAAWHNLVKLDEGEADSIFDEIELFAAMPGTYALMTSRDIAVNDMIAKVLCETDSSKYGEKDLAGLRRYCRTAATSAAYDLIGEANGVLGCTSDEIAERGIELFKASKLGQALYKNAPIQKYVCIEDACNKEQEALVVELNVNNEPDDRILSHVRGWDPESQTFEEVICSGRDAYASFCVGAHREDYICSLVFGREDIVEHLGQDTSAELIDELCQDESLFEEFNESQELSFWAIVDRYAEAWIDEHKGCLEDRANEVELVSRTYKQVADINEYNPKDSTTR